MCKNFGCTCPQCNFPHATSKCLNNVCSIDACNAGWADCDNNPVNGCEVDVTSDEKNCNVCGNACQQALFCIASQCVMTSCGDGALQNDEEVDPPVSPFMSVMVDQVTCRWDFSMVEQIYCNGACSWTGGNGCDQANADLFCRLKTGNPNSTASKFTTGVAIDKPGFPCPLGGNYGKLIGPLPGRGVKQNVYYQDTSILKNHGAGQVILTVDCN